MKTPSRLASIDGRRTPGREMQTANTKPPKRRFEIGQHFEYDGSVWRLIYMYRLAREQGVWFHCLEEQKGLKGTIAEHVANVFECLGAGTTTPRIVYEAFRSEGDAQEYFADIYRNGSQMIRTTQQLLNMKKV